MHLNIIKRKMKVTIRSNDRQSIQEQDYYRPNYAMTAEHINKWTEQNHIYQLPYIP